MERYRELWPSCNGQVRGDYYVVFRNQGQWLSRKLIRGSERPVLVVVDRKCDMVHTCEGRSVSSVLCRDDRNDTPWCGLYRHFIRGGGFGLLTNTAAELG